MQWSIAGMPDFVGSEKTVFRKQLKNKDQIEGIEWELIGHLQTNKVNQVVGRFSRIQTLDSSN